MGRKSHHKKNRPNRRKRSKRKLSEDQRAYVLIGMPGSGKSVLGRRVSKLLGWDAVDTDVILADMAGMSVGEFSRTSTNEQFRELEEAAVLSVRSGKKMIATGGSVVYSKRSMRHLKRIGTVIYLDLPYWLVERRVGDTAEKRGIILKEGQTLSDLFYERRVLYRRYADIEFQTYRLSPAMAAACLANLIRFMEENPEGNQEN